MSYDVLAVVVAVYDLRWKNLANVAENPSHFYPQRLLFVLKNSKEFLHKIAVLE